LRREMPCQCAMVNSPEAADLLPLFQDHDVSRVHLRWVNSGRNTRSTRW